MDADRDGDGWGAFADGTRRAIVARLAEGPQPVGQLAAGLPVSRSAVSQHLKVLKDAGLAALRDQLDAYWRRALSAYADVVEAPTEES